MAVARNRRGLQQLCVNTSRQENGELQLVITIPDAGNHALESFMNSLASSKSSPPDLAKEFHRFCSLLKISTYLIVALCGEEANVTKMVYKLAEDFHSLYQTFCDSLYDLMFSSYEAFRLFSKACNHYNGGYDTLGQHALEKMYTESDDALVKFDDLKGRANKLTEQVTNLNFHLRDLLAKRDAEDDVHVGRCLAESASCIIKIGTFLEDQKNFLAGVQAGFDLRQRCDGIDMALSRESFCKLISDVSPRGRGFTEELHDTIIRCVAANTLSGEYAKELRSKKEAVRDLVSTVVTKDMAQEGVLDLVIEYNKDFPDTQMPMNRVENIKQASKEWCPPPPYSQAPLKDDGWACVIQ